MERDSIEGYHLSPQQKRLWLLAQGDESYRAHAAVQFRGKLDCARLRATFQTIVARHQILRTTFERLPGMEIPLQVVQDDASIQWQEVDLRKSNAAERNKRIDKEIRRAEMVGLDLAHGPVLHCVLLRLSEKQHLVCVAFSSLCADAVSIRNLFQEAGQLYLTSTSGASADEPLQYVQYSEWYNQLLEGDPAEEGVLHWQQLLNGAVTPPLPFEARRLGTAPGAKEHFAPASVAVTVKRETLDRISTYLKKSDISPGVFFLTCWQALISKLSASSDGVIFSRFDGRSFEELRHGQGLYAKYLPVRAPYGAELRFSEAQRRVAKAVQDANLQQDSYFADRTMKDAEGMDSTQRSSIAFDHLDWADQGWGEEVSLILRSFHVCTEPFKLKLSVIWNQSAPLLDLFYDPAVYQEETAARIAEEFAALAHSAAAEPDSTLAELDLLGEQEQSLLLRRETRTEYPRERSIAELFEAQVERAPHDTAVVYKDEQLNFRELNSRANRLARHLRGLGVGPESLVALCFERSVEMIVGLLATLKAGGAYIPLDPSQPRQRLALMLSDAAPLVIATQQRLVGALPDAGVKTVCLDSDWEIIDREDDANLTQLSGPDNLAYVIYTSGSTGSPKGVMIKQSSVINLKTGLDHAVYFNQPRCLRVSLNAPLAFDASVKQVIQLLNGHALYILPDEIRADIPELLAFIKEQKLEALDCTPSQLRLLLEAGLDDLDGLKLLLVGGEPIHETLWTQLAGQGKTAVYNVYGPTECTVDATAVRLEGAMRTPQIGRGIANTQTYILDGGLRPVPTGVAGELCIGGDGVSRGYLNHSALTAEKFIPNSFSEDGGARIYRTGDRARFLPDGSIEFLGRMDSQVKIRGYRVELGEIEAVLNQHPAISEAAICVQEGRQDTQILAAYVVPSRKYARTVEGRRRYELPNGMFITHQNKNETDYLYQEIFENQIYFKHGVSLHSGACVFDVGANIGLFSLFVNQHCRDAKIYAFEPISPIFQNLRLNVEFYGGNVQTFQYGLSDRRRTDEFTYYPRYSMMSGQTSYSDPSGDVEVIKTSLHNAEGNGNGHGNGLLEHADSLLAGRFDGQRIQCDLRTLSDIIQEQKIDHIDLLKIDVQRAELDVLYGIRREDWAKISQIVMEVHDARGRESEGRVETLKKLLGEHGFKVSVEQDELLKGTDRYNLFATRELEHNDRRNGHSEAMPPISYLNLFDRPSQAALEHELKSYLRERLPDYMSPAAFVILDELPQTRNGKVDRRALPPIPQEQARTIDVVSKNSPIEEILCGAWAEVLGVDHVARNDNFFELGGHSLLATQLISRVRETFRVELPLRKLFEGPTVTELARAVEQVLQESQSAAPQKIERALRAEPAPLSFAQQRLWFLDQLEPGAAFYNMPTSLRLRGELDVEALEATLTELCRRHETLRTTFREVEGRPAQQIAPAGPRQIAIIDLSSLPEQEREQEIERQAEAESSTPFDLEQGPLLRVRLLRLEPNHHALLFTLHHIISDGWSMGVLIREVGALYEAYRGGRKSPLEELAIQYADYAVWQRDWLQGEALENQLSYWKGQLAGAGRLDMPTDRVRPAIQSYRGASESFALSAKLTGELKGLSRREGVTLFMTLLAGFQTLLGHYSGSEDIVVGTDIANRNRAETEGLIGFFVNQLVLRVDLSGEPSFRQLLRRVREMCLGAYVHQDLPFEKLVEELQPERSLSYSPLFQVSCSMNTNTGKESGIWRELELSPLGGENRTAKYDLTLMLIDQGEIVQGSVQYNTDLYDGGTIKRLIGHLKSLLESGIRESDGKLEDARLLTEVEERQILEEWNRTRKETREEESLHELFEKQVKRTPEEPALIYEEGEMSYRELDERASRLGSYLRGKGVGVETVVGLCLERSPEMVVGMLGVLKAGGAYAPVDPEYPAERLNWMLEDAGVKLVLTQEKVKERIEEWRRGEVVSVDGEWERIRESEGEAETGVSGENLAYVMYTSGSTGRPKGAQVRHKGLVNFSRAMSEELRLKKGDRFLQFASLSFDVAAEEIYTSLSSGAAVVLARSEELKDAGTLHRTLEKYGVSGVELPTAYWHEWVSELNRTGAAPPASLRFVIIGSGLPLREQMAAWQKYEVESLLVFGLTETTITNTTHRIEEKWNEEDNRREFPIGRPIANNQIYILNSKQRPTPIGVSGEIYIGGEGLARGYQNRPDLTAERFVPHPFSSEPGARLYRTGDLGRYRANGEIEFLGRVDQQVKLRGFRIELGEIEATLSECEGVEDAVVTVREDAPGDKRLVAYVTQQASGNLNGRELRQHLEKRLPDYMVPSSYVTLERLPLNPNGKVDRRALPAPETNRGVSEYKAPRTPVEEMLCGLWSETLRVGRVGADDNFFELGGHSLLATQLISRVREAFRVEIPLRALFEGPTAARLARTVAAALNENHSEASRRIERASREMALPLSFAQQRLWFLDQLTPGNLAYNVRGTLRLQGPLNREAMEWALSEILRRHELLRTTFPMIDGRPVQSIAAPEPVNLPLVDLSGFPETERDDELQGILKKEASRPFSLAEGPLFRIQLIRLREHEHQLLYTMHHITSDDWSMEVLTREITALYTGFIEGRRSPLPEPPIQYADYAVWQHDQARRGELKLQLDYWKRQLADSPPVLELPTDYQRPAMQSYRGATYSFRLAEELSQNLKALSRREDATLYMTLLAAFQTLLSRLTGQTDIVVGTPIAGRNRMEIEGLIGFFINSLAMRTDLSGDPSFRELLKRVREVALNAYTNQEIPFEQVVDELSIERNLSYTPVFQVTFGLQNAATEQLDLEGLSWQSSSVPSGAAKFDLTLSMINTEQEIIGNIHYSTDLFAEATIRRFASSLCTFLKEVARDPGQRLSRLSLLTPEERRRILEEWNQTAHEGVTERLFHQLFEEQAERAPNDTAVVFQGRELSYQELNRRSNQLAHYLRRKGVRAEVLVGLYVERSLEMVIALLGVLKAGGAYLPLDPTYPKERLAFILEDAGVPLLITHSPVIDGIPMHWGEVIDLDSDAPMIAQESEKNIENAADPENPAYAIYTSGSTGKPKGVLVRHSGLSHMTAAQILAFDLDRSSRILQFSSLSFDASIFEIAMALRIGACLQLISRESAFPGPELVAVLRQQEITVATLPPTVLAALPFDSLPALKTLIVAGEACSAELVAQWSVGRRFFNAYGPTETTVWATVAECIDLDRQDRRPPIGRPIANVEVYILDPHFQPTPIGVPGEICIGGETLARGYLNRSELTAEKFIPHPYSKRQGGRVYRTGDLARYRPDGRIEFLGRIDRQVKLRGFRIELGEIETALNQINGVRDVAIILREDAPGEKRLVAYLVCDLERKPAIEKMRDALSMQLPGYMIPSAFVALDEFPITPNGKVDVHRLPAPEAIRPELKQAFTAPKGALEEYLASRWREALNLEAVGVHDNFFDLGGDSIAAAILINQLQEELGETIQVVTIFDAPTIGQLAAYLEENHPIAVAGIIGAKAPGAPMKAKPAVARIDEAKAAQMRTLISTLSKRAGPPGPKNPAAVFILSPPRSGSTLLRVMLGGNPQLFAPPELELLGFNTLAERKALYTGRDSFWLEGTLRAIMESKGFDATQAKALMDRCEQQGMTTQEFFRLLQQSIEPRVLIDKTPSNALEMETLKRAEVEFENSRYIHLLRHPRGMIRSFIEAKIHQIYPHFEHPFTEHETAELIWLIHNQNILEFLSQIPPERQCRVKFEEMVQTPRSVMEGLTDFLGVPMNEEMLEPYREKKSRMTDGVHGAGHMLGDIKFHQHAGIESKVSERWREWEGGNPLGNVTWNLAVQLGYEREAEPDGDQEPAYRGLSPIIPVAGGSAPEELRSRLDQMSQEEIDRLLDDILSVKELNQ